MLHPGLSPLLLAWCATTCVTCCAYSHSTSPTFSISCCILASQPYYLRDVLLLLAWSAVHIDIVPHLLSASHAASWPSTSTNCMTCCGNSLETSPTCQILCFIVASYLYWLLKNAGCCLGDEWRIVHRSLTTRLSLVSWLKLTCCSDCRWPVCREK